MHWATSSFIGMSFFHVFLQVSGAFCRLTEPKRDPTWWVIAWGVVAILLRNTPGNWTFSYLKGLICSNLMEILHAIFSRFSWVPSIETLCFFKCYISVWYFNGSLCFADFLGLRGCQLWPPPKELVSGNFFSIKLNGSRRLKNMFCFFSRYLCCRKIVLSQKLFPSFWLF